jgi:Circularly permutated YpsA SLOG family
MKIISGGRTGVDRAALDVAIERGIPGVAGVQKAAGPRAFLTNQVSCPDIPS